jgi:hypothetical protein
VLCEGDGVVIATHHDHFWQLHGERYSHFVIEGVLWFYFEDRAARASRHFGPTNRFHCMDGVAYDGEQICAFCDQQKNDWYSYRDSRHWTVLCLTAVAPA